MAIDSGKPATPEAHAMRHPAQVATLLQPRRGWKIERGTTDFSGDDWTDAAAALAGASPLATASFLWIHCRDSASRRVLEVHLLTLVGELSNGVTAGELVSLALDEQHAPQAQRRDDLRALVLGVPLKRWERHYRQPHARLLSEIDSLAGDAWRVARVRMDAA
jgi:hypothetical protein